MAVTVTVLFTRFTSRVLPTDPVRAARAVLAFPDRDAGFDAIDEQAASLECFTAVRRAGGARDRDVADGE